MSVTRLICAVFSLIAAFTSQLGTARAQSAENVAVVINDNSRDSQRIGDYYAKKRAIPQTNIIRIRTSVDERVNRVDYLRTIEQPIYEALARERLQDRILYLVLTKGIPLGVHGTDGTAGTASSVDSELTLLYRRAAGQNVAIPGRVDNPYFLGDADMSKARSFTHREHDIYLVTRLDGFTPEDVIGLIDRGSAPRNEGRIVLDQQDRIANRAGEELLKNTSTRLTAQGFGERVLLETTVEPARKVAPVFGYFSWGSNDPRNRVRKTEMGFVPGALAANFVSTDARTFKEPPAEWVSSDNADKRKYFGGSGQSLVGDLIREGVTGTAGNVAEPFLQSIVRPDILFPAYLAGFNLVESFYLAMPHLSWMTVVIGDPLCAPVERRRLTRADLEDGVDAVTGLPGVFSRRRMAVAKAASKDLPDRAVQQLVRGEALLARKDTAGARAAFEEVVKLAPTHVGVLMQLAVMQDAAGDHDAAIQRYRRVLELQPNNALALNNLAYGLSVRQKNLTEALPLAQRAVEIAGQDPAVLDTLAWIEHLMGNTASATSRIAIAVKGAPDSAEVRMHAAVINATAGARAVAETQLREAIRLDPSLESSPEAKQVRALLDKLAAPK